MNRTPPCRKSAGCIEGDRSRKTVLVEHGFRLPSALDNRPLNFLEFQAMQGQTIYVSATPAPREWGGRRAGCAELVVRPTGLIDPRSRSSRSRARLTI